MRRRDLLKAGIGAAAALAAPRIGGAAAAKTLVVAPTADLVVLDPVVTFNRQTRNYAYLVFDTLYGLDTSWQAQPQMVEGHEVDDDGLTWLLRLRDGLRFHDNEPVLAKDVVASIRRFSVRVPFASALMAATDELSAADDRTVKFRLKRPFPHLPMALAGPGGTAKHNVVLEQVAVCTAIDRAGHTVTTSSGRRGRPRTEKRSGRGACSFPSLLRGDNGHVLYRISVSG